MDLVISRTSIVRMQKLSSALQALELKKLAPKLDCLPRELLIKIAAYLDFPEYFSLRSSNKHIHASLPPVCFLEIDSFMQVFDQLSLQGRKMVRFKMPKDEETLVALAESIYYATNHISYLYCSLLANGETLPSLRAHEIIDMIVPEKSFHDCYPPCCVYYIAEEESGWPAQKRLDYGDVIFALISQTGRKLTQYIKVFDMAIIIDHAKLLQLFISDKTFVIDFERAVISFWSSLKKKQCSADNLSLIIDHPNFILTPTTLPFLIEMKASEKFTKSAKFYFKNFDWDGFNEIALHESYARLSYMQCLEFFRDLKTKSPSWKSKFKSKE